MRVVFLGWLVVTATLCAAAGEAVVVTSKPRFERHGSLVYLTLAKDSKDYRIPWRWPPDLKYEPVSLNTNQVYSFTVTELEDRFPPAAKLRKVQFEGRTIFDESVCEVHGISMEFKTVPIRYGLLLPDVRPELERRYFPHARNFTLGGCSISRDSPKVASRYVCMECKAVYERWSAK